MNSALAEPAERMVDTPEQTIADSARFSLRGLPLLDGGATMDLLGATSNLWIHSKVYSNGGENAMHWHDVEDHLFFVLQGTATFHFGDGSEADVKAYEGIFLPKRTPYRFHAHEGDNLVLIRVGGGQVNNPDDIDPKWGVPREIAAQRIGTDGDHLDGLSKKNGTPAEPTVYRPGAFFMPV